MKRMFKKILPFILSVEILIMSFYSCSISVYAADFMPHDIIEAIEYGVKTNDWKPFYNFFYSSWDGLAYLYCQMGAFVTKDFQAWVNNNKALESLVDTVPARQEDNNIVFTKEFMAQLKALLDEYAKTEQTKEENGGFYLMSTINYEDVPMENFNNSYKYYTFRNIVREKGILSVRIRWNDYIWFNDPFSDPEHPILLVGNADSMNKYMNDPEARVGVTYFCAYDWKSENFPLMYFKDNEKIHYSCSEAVQYNTGSSGYVNESALNKFDEFNYNLFSTTGERVRVFVSKYAAQNYSVGNRKIYFSENYYNYEPEDLTVAVDDLQKSVDDLQKIIDELLKKIGDNTSEKEIEELLKQILDELRKNPGGGGGSSSSGDVTVSVDLKETNSWLSKIYAKVSQIYDKMNTAVEDTSQAVFTDIKKSIDDLSKMLEKYLKTISSDLDDIKDQLADMSEQEFSDQTESFLDDTMGSFSEVSEKAKGKFPFSIPNDIRLLIIKMSVSQPEDHGQDTYSLQTLAYDEDVGDNGLISVMDEGGGDVPVISETGAPIFYLPFVIASAEIEQYVLIDLSGFEPISSFCRSLMTIWFVLCLYNLTFKVMGLWGDLVD